MVGDHLYESPDSFLETESQGSGRRLAGREEWLLFNENSFRWRRRSVLEMDTGNVHTALSVLSAIEVRTENG